MKQLNLLATFLSHAHDSIKYGLKVGQKLHHIKCTIRYSVISRKKQLSTNKFNRKRQIKQFWKQFKKW